jgi:ABC-type Fe3+-siderophore transport system permease subunit
MRERRIALGILIFGLVSIFYFIPTQIELTDDYDQHSLSPAAFPNLASWIIIALAGVLLLKSFRSPFGDEKGKSADAGSGQITSEAILFGLSILYVFGFHFLGFLPATAIIIFIFFFLQGVRPVLKLLILSSGVTISVYLFFHFAMKIHFDYGVLFG